MLEYLFLTFCVYVWARHFWSPINFHNPIESATRRLTYWSRRIQMKKYKLSHSDIARLELGEDYKSLSEVNKALRTAGLESSSLIIGIDYTKSNINNGEHTFDGKSLHHISTARNDLNPYQSVISVIGRTLESFDDDRIIPTYGFGDATTRDHSVFPLFDWDRRIGVSEVLKAYNARTPSIHLSGPTNFAPLIYKAMDICRDTNAYHILVIIADGQVTQPEETRRAIVDASCYPLSIIMVGVGDGPWELMNYYDMHEQTRCFDNFHFVDFNKYKDSDPEFAVAALQEIPAQYRAVRELGYITA